ncbi:hypothetical protein M427DRAFT_271331 [Gonapodya prolifera JEL478]|uniref:TPR-like protein n=1 Tax=Gonapodya prolifera (strain JEL478) TaxID=1344416 RepID=A0A139AXK5_GONPJ|nr:hypothetical protein M427DRAFT_271331 [Gonapodya prolifera JEL478]|eukprot:KXS21481.1 hypothetical protein M427DRAFT_271331 [Gonapodya prolifera JEL478]
MPIDGLPGWREAKDAAAIALNRNDLARAERSISKAIQLHPTNTSLLDFRYQLYLRTGKNDHALSDAQKMIPATPGWSTRIVGSHV